MRGLRPSDKGHLQIATGNYWQAARLAGSAEGAVHWSGSDAEGLAGEDVGNLDSAEPEVFLEGYDEANGITDVIEDG